MKTKTNEERTDKENLVNYWCQWENCIYGEIASWSAFVQYVTDQEKEVRAYPSI